MNIQSRKFACEKHIGISSLIAFGALKIVNNQLEKKKDKRVCYDYLSLYKVKLTKVLYFYKIFICEPRHQKGTHFIAINQHHNVPLEFSLNQYSTLVVQEHKSREKERVEQKLET